MSFSLINNVFFALPKGIPITEGFTLSFYSLCILTGIIVAYVYGIKVYNMKSLVMFTKNKKKHIATIKDSSDIDYIIETISQNNPHIITGYSKELEKCFKKDFETFINLNSRNEETTDQTTNQNSF